MTEFRCVTPAFWVAPQIDLADLARAKAEGFTLIINNRPDGEAPGQPPGEEIAAAAQAAGLAYLAAPVVGMPGPAQVAAVRSALEGSAKTLAFCRSGTRSIVTWALGQANDDNRQELARLGAAAGYDLGPVLGV
jgi:uncharacterized protein (TIGR01244 family)